MSSIIEIKNLSYKIKDKKILDNINITINEGEAFALIGINGSGKSTLISSILGDIIPNQGEITIKSNSPKNYKEWGVLYDFPYLYDDLTVDETIKMFASLNNVRYQYVVEKYYPVFEIGHIKRTLTRQLSAGEKRRVSILISILRPINLLILDEPFSNLDPIMIDKMWEVIKEDGRTILFSSHDWGGVELMASRVAFIYNGKIIGEPQNVEEILNGLPSTKIISFMKESMIESFNVFEHFIAGNNVSLFYDKKKDYCDIFSILNNNNINYSVRNVGIRDAYMYKTIKINKQ